MARLLPNSVAQVSDEPCATGIRNFTTLSIAKHSRLSSLERVCLLITLGLKLSHIRDWKFGVLESWVWGVRLLIPNTVSLAFLCGLVSDFVERPR